MAFPDLSITTNAQAEAEFVNRSGLTDITNGFNLIDRLAAWAANLMVSSPPAATVLTTSSIKSSGTAGVGYATGAGGAVTQLTNKSTGVTLNKTCGQITMNNASLAAGAEVAFTLTNSTIAATDVVVPSIASGGTSAAYGLSVTATAAGSCEITVSNLTAGALGEALVLNFVVIKGVAA